MRERKSEQNIGNHLILDSSLSHLSSTFLSLSQMEKIEHKSVEVNGLKLHVAEIENGPKTVLFCHGFPEIWYSWRHQMVAVASAGFRALAPDYRGYGFSDPPPVPEKANYLDFVSDLHALIQCLGIPKVDTLLLIVSFCESILLFPLAVVNVLFLHNWESLLTL